MDITWGTIRYADKGQGSYSINRDILDKRPVVSDRFCETNPICLLFTWTYKIKDTNSPVFRHTMLPQSQKAAPVAHSLQGCSTEQGDCNAKGMRTKRELACQVVLARWAGAKKKGQRTSGAFFSGFAPATRSAQISSSQYSRNCALGYQTRRAMVLSMT
jgi:hypothetical protein